MNTPPLKLIVGLGNPGREYFHTRHNAGMWFVERCLAQINIQPQLERKFFGQVAKTVIDGRDLRFLLPQTYMNESGKSVSAIAQFYKIQPEEMLVVHDELDLPVGTVRLKKGGGNGGHNGLKSIDQQLGSKAYWRLRIGIDHPGHKSLVTAYVLKAPPMAEFEKIIEAFDPVFHQMDNIVHGDFETAMMQLHQKNS